MKEVEELLNKSASGIKVEIKLFATSKELFTYKNVVSNETLDEAKEYHYVYENLQKPEEERWKLTQEEQWKNSFVETKDDNGNIVSVIEKTMKKRSISRYHAIYEINRQISQNFSNSLHRSTKLILMGIDKNSMNDRLKLFEKYRKTRVPKTIKYHCNEKDAGLLNNMALVEHERWIAAHKLMGYTWASSTEYVKKHHKCMCDFEKLDSEETQSYDCNVVDTTIKMAFQELNKKKF